MEHLFANSLSLVLPAPTLYKLELFRPRLGPERCLEIFWDISSLPPILRQGGGSDVGRFGLDGLGGQVSIGCSSQYVAAGMSPDAAWRG